MSNVSWSGVLAENRLLLKCERYFLNGYRYVLKNMYNCRSTLLFILPGCLAEVEFGWKVSLTPLRPLIIFHCPCLCWPCRLMLRVLQLYSSFVLGTHAAAVMTMPISVSQEFLFSSPTAIFYTILDSHEQQKHAVSCNSYIQLLHSSLC